MSPETDASDHVPIEFLLGARAKYYASTYQEHNTKAKRIFAPSIHPRRREEQARQLLERALVQEDMHNVDRSFGVANVAAEAERLALQNVLSEATSTSISHDNRIKALQQIRDDDLERQHQRTTSFHGYEQDNRVFLGIMGTPARMPKSTRRQLQDRKLTVMKEKGRLQEKRTQELLEILQEQQEYTRIALHRHQQCAHTLQQRKNLRVVSTQNLALGSIADHDDCNNINKSYEESEQTVLRLPISLQRQELYDATKRDEGLTQPQRLVLATLDLDVRALSLSPPNQRKSEATGSDTDLISISTTNEEESFNVVDAEDDGNQVRKRLSDRQREVFANSAAKMLYRGGGFIGKRVGKEDATKTHQGTTKPMVSSNTQAASEYQFLEAVLGAHTASILPLAEAHKAALRRRKANACPRRLNKFPTENNEASTS